MRPSEDSRLPPTTSEAALRCGNPVCPSGETKAEFKCSGCHSHRYCSRDCQVAAWSFHRFDCAHLAAHYLLKDDSAAPVKQLKAYMMIFTGSHGAEMIVASRSALRLNRPDELAETHFILLHARFEKPQTPIDLNDVPSVRKCFIFEGAEVMADVDAPEHLRREIASWRKIARKKPYLRMSYLALFVKSSLSQKIETITANMAIVKELSPSDNERLNPHWEQYIEKCFKRDFYPKTMMERVFQARMDDFSCYESQEFLEQEAETYRVALEIAAKGGYDEAAMNRNYNKRRIEKGEAAASLYSRDAE